MPMAGGRRLRFTRESPHAWHSSPSPACRPPRAARRRRRRTTHSLGDVLRAAVQHPGYIAMTAAFFACGFQLVFITTHLPSYLAFCGLPPSVGASALAVIGLCNTVGTYIVGLLGARYSQKRLLALVYMIRTLSIAVYLAVPVTPGSTLALPRPWDSYGSAWRRW